MGKLCSFARTLPFNMLAGFYFAMKTVNNMDFRGGGLGDNELFKDNFQEYHPPNKISSGE